MSDTLTLTGQLAITPDPSQTDAALSGDFTINVPLNLSLTLSAKESTTLALPVNDGIPEDVTVSLAAVGQPNFLLVRVTTPSYVTISGSNSTQIVDVDSLLILHTGTTPITALSIQCVDTAGIARVVMGTL